MNSICVYSGSSDKTHQDFQDAAYEMGAVLAGEGIVLVYGAGSTGLMGAVADGALESGGKVVGVMPEIFNTPKLAHQKLTRLEIVEDLHQRKARLAELADGFIALPGGFGTMEELFEILTWAQIGLHTKPIGLLNVRHYFDPLLDFIDSARAEGFIYTEHRSLFSASEKPSVLLKVLQNHSPPSGLERWLTRED
jgi:uncharacterized protein (TIGR00730 family)